MNRYVQPDDEFVLSLLLEDDDCADLKEYLKHQAMFEKISERTMAFDHEFDPNAVVEEVWDSKLALKVAPVAMQVGKDAAHIAVCKLITAWVQKRNEKKKDKIEAKETEPLLYDQYGHQLSIRPESKRNKS